MNFRQLDLLKNSLIDWNVNYSVYPYNGYTINEVLCQFFDAINKGIVVINDYTKWVDELLNWIKAEGLEEEVKQALDKMINDGVFDKIINGELFGEITEQIGELEKTTNDNKEEIKKLQDRFTSINVLHPQKGLKPCKGNGTTDDIINLQKIHDYLEENGGGEIIIPKCVIRITDTFYWNMRKVTIKCKGKIFADINGYDKYAIASRSDTSSDYDVVYENDLIENEGVEIYGKREINGNNEAVSHGTCNGLLIADVDKVGCSRICFDKIKISFFRTGLTLGENSYANHFNRISITKCDLNLKTKVMSANAGEKWSFENSLFYNSKDCFEFNNDNSTIFFYNCSIDYNYNKIIQLNRGKVSFDQCHIEQLEEHYNGKIPIIMEQNDGVSLTFSNCFIMFNYNPEVGYVKKFLFKNNYGVNPFSGITFDNCFFQGCKTATGYLTDDSGLNVFKNTSTYQWDTVPCYVNHFSNHVIDGQVLNADINHHTDYIVTNGAENIEKGVKFQAWGEGDGGHALMCKKTGQPKNFAEVSFIVPIDKACHLVSAKLDYKSNVDDTIDIYFGTCTMVGDKIGYRNYLFRNGLLGTGTGAQTFEVNNGHQINIQDNKATHFFLSVNLFNTKQNTEIYLKNICIDQI